MENDDEIWHQYYEKILLQAHSRRTEFAIKLNKSNIKTAVDMGCGTGSDCEYMAQLGYQVYGFDINSESISICQKRFKNSDLVAISKASFETYDYPKSGVVIANNSLYFAHPTHFKAIWDRIVNSLEKGGVFAGDFMGVNDDWATGFRNPTSPMNRSEIESLFHDFDVIRFHERDESGKTAIGKTKHWHTFSVLAVKARS
jgi:trans-aconitate methyltransferase